jgi:hypothetical protein
MGIDSCGDQNCQVVIVKRRAEVQNYNNFLHEVHLLSRAIAQTLFMLASKNTIKKHP